MKFRASRTRGWERAKILPADQPITHPYLNAAAAANTILFSEWVCLHEVYHGKIAAHIYYGLEPPSRSSGRTVLSQLPLSTMKADSQRPKEREADLNAAIEALDLAKTSSILPAKAVFGTVAILLTTIKVCFMLSRNDLLHKVHTWLGLNDQRTGLC